MLTTLSQIPDKAWLFVVLIALLALFAYRPDPIVQRWAEISLIALIAVLKGGAQTTVVVGEPQASKVLESLTKNG
jgi:hypothetical protein